MYICICMYLHTYICTCIHTYMRTYTHPSIYIRRERESEAQSHLEPALLRVLQDHGYQSVMVLVRMTKEGTNKFEYTYKHACMHAYLRICMHAHKHVNIHLDLQAYVHIRICICVCIYVCVHVYMYKCIYIYIYTSICIHACTEGTSGVSCSTTAKAPGWSGLGLQRAFS